MKFPIITRYTVFQLRLGILKILALLATPGREYKDGMAKKLDGALKRKNDDYDDLLISNVILSKEFENKYSEKLTADILHGVLSAVDLKRSRFSILAKIAKLYLDKPYLSLLLLDPALSVREGFLPTKNAVEMVDLAQSLGLISDSCSILENTTSLLTCIGDDASKVLKGDISYNPLILDQRGGHKEKTNFLMYLLLSDLPIVFMAAECLRRGPVFHRYCDYKEIKQKTKSDNIFSDDSDKKYSSTSMLLDVYRRIDEVTSADFGVFDNIKEIQQYFLGKGNIQSLDTTLLGGELEFRMGLKNSFMQHATPRLEFFVDLGLLDRHRELGQSLIESDFNYRTTDRLVRFNNYIQKYLIDEKPTLDIDKFIRRRLFAFVDYVYDIQCEKVADKKVIFKYFIKGFRYANRGVNYSAGRTCALIGCLLAQDDKKLIEIKDMYETITEYGHKKEYHSLLSFSGGSRFDDEFLIKIDPKLYEEQR